MNIKAVLIDDEFTNMYIVNQLYEFYINIWAETWRELKIDAPYFQDDFCRFNSKVGFFVNDKPIAFHAYRYFNMESQADRNHSYFAKLDVPLASELRSRGLNKIATLEYMAVDPTYRRTANRPVGDMLAAFSTQLFRARPVDAAIGVTRNDRGVNRFGRLCGGYQLYENIAHNNVTVDVIVFEPKNITNHPDCEIQKIIDNLLDQCQQRTPGEMAA